MKKCIIVLAILLLNIKGYSQKDSLKVYYLDTVRVTASKYEQVYKNMQASQTVVSNESLRKDAKGEVFASLNGRAPGLFINERGFGGFGISTQSAGKISMRGISGANQILVLVDGRPEFSGIFGHPLPDGYIASEIEDVEVTRGPASVLYGSGAMGGVINIITKKAQRNGLGVFTEFNYGTFNTFKLSGAVSYKTDDYGARISADAEQTDGSRSSSSFKTKIASFSFYYNLNSNWFADVDGFVNRSKAYNPGTVANPYKDNSAWTDVTRANISLSLKNRFDGLEGETQLFFNNGVHDIYDGFHSNDNTIGFSSHQGFTLFEKSIVTVGADVKRYGGLGRTSKPIIDTTVIEGGAFVFVTQPVTDEIKIGGGLRLQDHSSYGVILIPQININYNPVYTTRLHAAAVKGFRSPVITELFLSPIFQPYKGINPNLKPEKLWSYELGVKQKLFSGKLTLGLTGFLAEGKDLIVRTGVIPFMKYENLAQFRNRGIEFEAEMKVTKELYISANYSYTAMDNKVVGIPAELAFIEGVYTCGILSVSANLRAVNSLSTVLQQGSTAAQSQSYALLNMSASVNPVRQVSVYIKGDNLLNRSYETIAGYPMPGSAVVVGVVFNGLL